MNHIKSIKNLSGAELVINAQTFVNDASLQELDWTNGYCTNGGANSKGILFSNLNEGTVEAYDFDDNLMSNSEATSSLNFMTQHNNESVQEPFGYMMRADAFEADGSMIWQEYQEGVEFLTGRKFGEKLEYIMGFGATISTSGNQTLVSGSDWFASHKCEGWIVAETVGQRIPIGQFVGDETYHSCVFVNQNNGNVVLRLGSNCNNINDKYAVLVYFVK